MSAGNSISDDSHTSGVRAACAALIGSLRDEISRSAVDRAGADAAHVEALVSRVSDLLLASAEPRDARQDRYPRQSSVEDTINALDAIRRTGMSALIRRGSNSQPPPIELANELNEAIWSVLADTLRADAAVRAASAGAQTGALIKFLSFLSHDMRGGLNGAILMLEVLKRQLSTEPSLAEAAEDLELTRRSILDSVATMERFLFAEKMRLGRQVLRIGVVRVSKLLNDVQKTQNFKLADRGIACVWRVDPDELTIETDAMLLALVLQSLVDNAIKFGRNHQITIAASQVAPSGACRFSVRDQGSGMTAQKIAEIFAPFSEGEMYGTPGIGLGLFVARQAADLLGGRLSAESEVGGGTTFHFELPATRRGAG